MGMFDNYINQDTNYIPDNMHDRLADSEIVMKYSSLAEEHDETGKLIDYKWDYGNSNNFYFTVNRVIHVPEDALLYDEVGREPRATTVGKIGQKCYNVTDIRSWTCTEIRTGRTQNGVETSYIWVVDDGLVYDENDPKEVTLTPNMTDKMLVITFTDWRRETVFTRIFEGANSAVVCITDDVSKDLFIRGLYTCTVAIVSDDYYLTEETIKFRVV